MIAHNKMIHRKQLFCKLAIVYKLANSFWPTDRRDNRRFLGIIAGNPTLGSSNQKPPGFPFSRSLAVVERHSGRGRGWY